jgi:hypothetical protein
MDSFSSSIQPIEPIPLKPFNVGLAAVSVELVPLDVQLPELKLLDDNLSENVVEIEPMDVELHELMPYDPFESMPYDDPFESMPIDNDPFGSMPFADVLSALLWS